MKTTYSSSKNWHSLKIKRASAISKVMLVTLMLWAFSGFNNVSAQVSITAPSIAVTACTSFPTSAGALGNIVITESANGDISSFGTLILTAPANFQFTSAGTGNFTAGRDITGVTSVLTNSTTITLTISGSSSSALDMITISGIQVIGITSATPASNVTRTGGTSVINGDANGAVHASLTSTLTPTLNSNLTPSPICNASVFNYTPTSSVAGTTFAWTRAAVSNISNGAGSGAGNPSETLINTSVLPVNVTYVYTLSANGCTNSTSYSVVVTVNPTPTLSSTLNPPSICSGTFFSYTPASSSGGATFSWTRAAVSNISNLAGSGSGDPNEALINTSASPVNVTYAYTVTANGCTNPTTYNVVVTVNSSPSLSSTTVPAAICSGTVFSYSPASSTSGTTFAWTRAAVGGISNTAGSGSGNPNEILTNTTASPVNVTYVYTLTANGCANPTTYNVVVTVNPAPSVTTALAPSNTTCTSATANWAAAAGALAYYLDVSTDTSFATTLGNYTNLNVGNVTTLNITGLAINTTYYYRVRTNNNCGTSLNSNTITVNNSAPAAPTATAANNFTCTSASANWTAAAGALSYSLDVSSDASFSTLLTNYNNVNVGNVLTYNVTGLQPNVTYYCRVRASNGCVAGLNSNTITWNTSPPSAPAAAPADSVTCSSINANWGAVSGATIYYLDVSINASFATTLGNYTNLNVGNVTTFSITGLTVNTTYYYRVRASNGCSSSLNSNSIAVSTFAPALSSTLTPPAVFSGAIFSYTPASSTAGATFAWTRASVIGISNTNGSGTGNPNEVLTNTTNAPINVTYVFTVTANGCTNPTAYSVVVTVNPAGIVWPGDANNDSLVSNIDLLPIGLYYGQSGLSRATANNIWQADMAANWGTLETNGQDRNHADCNGDGTIDDNDTLAINQNFNLVHAIVPFHNTNYNELRTTADMYFVISGSSYNAGDWVNAEVWLGTSTTPVSGLYGVSFNINFDASLVQSGTETMTYASSWLGTPGTNVIKIAKTDELAATTYGAITRTTHTDASGFGKIADYKFQVKNSLTSSTVMHLSICCITADNAAGVLQTLTAQADSVSVNPVATGIQENSNTSSIAISPNPFNSQTTISFSKKIKNGTVKIVDVVGKVVKTIEFSGNQLVLEKGELNPGIYFVQVVSEKNVIANKKIVIE